MSHPSCLQFFFLFVCFTKQTEALLQIDILTRILTVSSFLFPDLKTSFSLFRSIYQSSVQAISVRDIFRYLPSTAPLSQKEIRGRLLMSSKHISLHKASHHATLKTDECEQTTHSEVLPYITKGESFRS